MESVTAPENISTVPAPSAPVIHATEAERKARKIGENGCFKNRLDTITATENGTEYTYKPAN